ncbi:MAG TPA: hypothetical protein VNC15_00165 [Solirubrobacterales bacterium]|nr:hypothetical protein [Solirubrobacterales bacterium]
MKALYRSLSRARHKRAFHPFGAGFSARLSPASEEAAGVGALGEEREVLVRLSRSLGLPEWLPDPCGLAIRAPDAYGPGCHQDLLMVSSARPPGGRHALLPSRAFGDLPYSTLLPYRLRGETVLFGARARGPRPGPKLADLREREVGGLEFELQIAGLRGSWRPLATLSLGERLPPAQTERLGFDPTNTGGGLELVGLLNRLRGPAYAASQEGRATAYSESRSD